MSDLWFRNTCPIFPAGSLCNTVSHSYIPTYVDVIEVSLEKLVRVFQMDFVSFVKCIKFNR